MIKINKKNINEVHKRSQDFWLGGEVKPKSHVMTLLNFFEKNFFFEKRRIFSGQRYRRMEGQKRRPGLAYSLGFAKEKGLEPKLKRFPKLSKLEDVVSKLV